MQDLWLSTLQDRTSFKNKADSFRRVIRYWWNTRGDEQEVIQNLLTFLDKSALPECCCLKEVNRLIDYHIYSEPKDYLEDALLQIEESEELCSIKYLLARCYQGLGLLDEALVYLEDALEVQPNNNFYWQLKADCLLELGDWQAAIDCYNKSLRSSPGNAETIYRMGTIFMFQGEFGEALNCFSGCCKLMPYESSYWEMQAEMLLKLNQIAAAAGCFRKAIKYGGRHNISSRLAYCYAKTGQINKARKLLLKVLRHDPDNYESLGNLAGIYHKLDNNEEAYKLLKRAYTLNCNDPLLLNNLGYICFKLGRSRKALEYYQQALSLDPSDTIVLYNLSVCLFTKGNWEESRAALEKLLAIDNNNLNAWILLGNVNEQLALYKVSVDCFNKSLGLA